MRPRRRKPDIETCLRCGAKNAYAWQDSDVEEDGTMPEGGEVYHISVASCWEWQCGKCRTHHVERRSPINHPCYTHSED